MHGNANALSRIDTRPYSLEDCPDHGHLIKKVKSASQKKPRLYKETNTINCWAHKKALINSHMLRSHITVRVNKYTTDWA